MKRSEGEMGKERVGIERVRRRNEAKGGRG